MTESGEPSQRVALPTSDAKITSAIWGGLEDFILTGHENGEVCQFDVKVCGVNYVAVTFLFLHSTVVIIYFSFAKENSQSKYLQNLS